MDLTSRIRDIQDALGAGRFPNEAAVRQGIVNPILNALGWPIFDPQVVWPEYSVQGRRVDLALCHPRRKPAVFVEIKQVGMGEGAERQLFEYAFHLGIPMAVLTDGQEWHFFLPAEQGSYQERRVYRLDLLERQVDESVARLTRYLAYDSVRSGEALDAARSDYRDVARTRETEGTIPAAWRELLSEDDSLLVQLLSDKVEVLCGFKPDPDSIGRFLATQAPGAEQRPVSGTNAERRQRRTVQQAPIAAESKTSHGVGFALHGQESAERNARGVLVHVLEELSARDGTFLERLAARKHGRTRRYVARTAEELYPNRPDLARDHSHQLRSGWWVGLNYSKSQIRQILALASDVAGLKFGTDLVVHLE